MRSAIRPLAGAALDIAAAAAERRPAGRNGSTSGRNGQRRANFNRGSVRADVPVIVRFPFVIPAERVLPS
jgi:hypothetical protein